jgi:hypothetical protein
MKPETDAWKQLEEHASAHLRTGFATRVLRATRPIDAQAWAALETHASNRLRGGFADRVLRAVRVAADIPSFFSQFALSAATVAVCLGAVVYLHDRALRQQDARSLADWQRLALETQELYLDGQ